MCRLVKPTISSDVNSPLVHRELGLKPKEATAKAAFASSIELNEALEDAEEDQEGEEDKEGEGGFELHGNLASIQPNHRCWLEIHVRRVIRLGSEGFEFESWIGIILEIPIKALDSSWGFERVSERVCVRGVRKGAWLMRFECMANLTRCLAKVPHLGVELGEASRGCDNE